MALQAAAVLLSLVAVSIAIGTYVRAGRWKEGDDAKELVAKVEGIDRRLTTVETQVKNLATKEDVAGLAAELRGLERLIQKTDAGVERIEQFFISKGVA